MKVAALLTTLVSGTAWLAAQTAAELHHTQLYPVDFQSGMRIDSVMAYASVHDTPFVAWFNATVTHVAKLLDRMQRERPDAQGAVVMLPRMPVEVQAPLPSQ